jgi:hypothetical protein
VAVCRSDSTLTVFVFWEGDSSRIEQVTSAVSSQSDSCRFRVATASTVKSFYEYWRRQPLRGQEPLPAIGRAAHDGIEELLGGGSSVLHYRHQGKWLTISGMD